MKLSQSLALGAIAMGGAAALPASAHHSYAMFDMNQTIVLDATVQQFRWSNPHAFIRVSAKVGNAQEDWAIEMNSPNNLIQEGWTRTKLRSGDKIKLYVHPLRSGARGGSYSGVRLADGSTLGDVD